MTTYRYINAIIFRCKVRGRSDFNVQFLVKSSHDFD